MNSKKQDLNLVGEFTGRAVGVGKDLTAEEVTLMVYPEHFTVPELRLKVPYGAVLDVGGGHPGTAESSIPAALQAISVGPGSVMVVTFRESAARTRTLAVASDRVGPDSIDYCQIMLYRAFAASKVRSRNGGKPCYGIIGY
jgi:hypothetical protein